MRADQHEAEAEALLQAAGKWPKDPEVPTWLAAAQAHATLAVSKRLRPYCGATQPHSPHPGCSGSTPGPPTPTCGSVYGRLLCTKVAGHDADGWHDSGGACWPVNPPSRRSST